MSHSILRRYTPPTCTLEIMANSSPLSRWMGQPVLKDLRWRLKLDDPKVTADQWTQIQGDRGQLEALREAVQSYVQNLLDHSQGRLDEAFNPAAIAVASAVTAAAPAAALQETSSIALHPHGLLSHDLILGSLATETSGPMLALSTLQLFDLANALDEYATDLITLPDLQRPVGIKTAPTWTKVAAMAVVVIGVAASIAKILDVPSPQTASAPNSQGASSSDQRIANQLPPDAIAKSSPLVNPTVGLPPLLGGKPGATPGTLPPGTLPKVNLKSDTGTNAPAGTGQSGSFSGTINAPGNPTVTPVKPSITIADGQPASAPTLEQRSPASSKIASGLNPDELAAASQDAMAGTAAAPPTRSAAIPLPDNARSRSTAALEPLPQVDEIKQYFQGRWKPIPGVTSPLEYQVELGADGAIQRVVPLGSASRDYIEKSTIPLNEVIVSPLTQGKVATLRLILNPNGKVDALLEKIMQ
jgi:Domain of unknown function (DUF4335)